MHYYICYKRRRLMGPMAREEAIKELFALSGAFQDLYIQIVDEKTGKVKGEIKPGRRRK